MVAVVPLPCLFLLKKLEQECKKRQGLAAKLAAQDTRACLNVTLYRQFC
jgi:hypothetical protein